MLDSDVSFGILAMVLRSYHSIRLQALWIFGDRLQGPVTVALSFGLGKLRFKQSRVDLSEQPALR